MELRKCPVCGGKLRSESLGWICYDCKGFINMQGVFHEHKEKPFMPPQTNADRIRAMSDEELSKIINAFNAYFEECNRSLTDTDCRDCELCELCSLGEGEAIDWLKQPVEE